MRRSVVAAGLAGMAFGAGLAWLALPARAPEPVAGAATPLAGSPVSAPERVREARPEAPLPAEAHDRADSTRAPGAEDALFAVRASRPGPEAAERPAALDAKPAAWKQRLADYRAARDALRADSGLDESERARALEALRRERFEGAELERVRALDAGS